MIRVGIYGATGYTGFEVLRLLARHPDVTIGFAAARSAAGQTLRDIFPTTLEVPIIHPDETDPASVDFVFSCLPHGSSMPTVVRALAAGSRVIDLSADFRLHTTDAYTRWYQQPHDAPQLLGEAIYGLPELHRADIRTARLVANPGCYPTTVILALAPLVRAGLLADTTVIADSKSGVSGAGRGLSLTTHFSEAHENFSAYKVGHRHRHIAEMEQETGLHVIFSPHLLPVVRGILSTIYINLHPGTTAAALHAAYALYDDEPFVAVLPERLPELRHAVHTNLCVIGTHLIDEASGRAILVSVADNLIKGAAGQAIQNMNLMADLPETQGLPR